MSCIYWLMQITLTSVVNIKNEDYKDQYESFYDYFTKVNCAVMHDSKKSNATDHEQCPRNRRDLGPFSMSKLFTHFPLDKVAVISQTIVSDAFLWMKVYFH